MAPTLPLSAPTLGLPPWVRGRALCCFDATARPLHEKILVQTLYLVQEGAARSGDGPRPVGEAPWSVGEATGWGLG